MKGKAAWLVLFPLLTVLPFLLPYLWLFQGLSFHDAFFAEAWERFAPSLGATFRYALASAALAFVLGFPLATLYPEGSPLFRKALFGLLLCLLAAPAYVYAVGMTSLAAAWPGISPLLYSFPGAVLLRGWLLAPLPAFFALAALRFQPAAYEAAALLDGSRWKRTLWLRAPRLLPAALGGTGLAALIAWGDFTIPDLLFARNPQQLRNLAADMQMLIGAYYDMDGARTLAFLYVLPALALFALAMALLFGAFSQQSGDEEEEGEREEKPGLALVRWTLFSLLLVPFALAWGGLIRALAQDWAALWAVWLSAWDEIARSLAISATAALGVVLLGVVLSLVLPQKSRGIWAASLGWALPFLLPGSVLGLALLEWFSQPGWAQWRDGPLPLFLVYFWLGPPLAWPLMLTQSRKVPVILQEVARLDGLGPWGRFRHLLFPWARRAWLAAFGLCFLWNLGESAASMLVAAPGQTPLSVRTLTVMHYGPGPMVAALCLIAAILALAVPLLLALLWRKGS